MRVTIDNAIKIKAPLTKGLAYDAKYIGNGRYTIVDDEGHKINIKINDCDYLGGGNWSLVKHTVPEIDLSDIDEGWDE